MKLALFDFDGTITTEDSLLEFIIFVRGKTRFVIGIFALSPILFGYAIGIVNHKIAKQWILRMFFRGMSKEHMEELGIEFIHQRLPQILNPHALDRIRWHQSEGHEVVVVSASAPPWIEPWCKANQVKVICTQLEFSEKRFTGKISGRNCRGKEKVSRIQENYNLDDVEFVYAYGNSKGDKPMLALANESHYRVFG
jgi:HAD superfamily hydrolase (TIGR01490 family)